ANSLLSASFSGRIAGESAAAYVKNVAKGNTELPQSAYDAQQKLEQQKNEAIASRTGGENAFALHREAGNTMREHVFVERDNRGLDKALAALGELKQRAANVALDDRRSWANQSLSWARQVQDMIVLAEVIAKSARMRDECRGSHYKAEFELKIPEGKFEGAPEYDEYKQKWKANNDKWLKHTFAMHTPNGPEISYGEVDISVLPPEKPRDYR
ncbi:MAG: succinate dehydrogenase flavoprotein subunit, partial [Phycisphaerae bacterium]|nr:succinate dehydrogenase flavoprotein subunit [Phycisphaerae bacterium]